MLFDKFRLNDLQMQALKTTLYAVCAGAFGLFARWMQLMLAFDDSDLPKSSAWNLLFPMVVVAAVIISIHFSRDAGRHHYVLPEGFTEAFAFTSPVVNAVRYAAGGLMIIGAVLLLLTCETEKHAVMMRILAGLGVLSGISYPLMLGMAQNKDSNPNLRCLCAALPIVMFSFWLILTYKMNDINSVEWDYGIEILADCVGIYSFFRMAGFAFDVPNTKRSMFWAMFAPFCFFVCLADDRLLGMQVMYVAAAVMMLLNNWIFVCNLKKDESSEAARTEPDDGFERL